MRRNNGKAPKMNLKLNLTSAGRSRGGPSRAPGGGSGSPHGSSSSSMSTSPPSSCVSSESDQGMKSNSPEATSMVLAGCPRCLMYVMLSEKEPRCPKCNSTVLLDFKDNDNGSK